MLIFFELSYQITCVFQTCYYKSNNVSELFTVGKIWCEFSLVLSFISFRSGADEYILATEAGEWLTLEDGDTLIDMGDGD